MITAKEISERIAEAINTSGKTKAEISRSLGVHHSQISRYVSGEKLPSVETLANLCVVLDVDPAEILCTNEKI